jgi:hypothetical protein
MFVCAIIVLRKLNLTRGKLEAEEVGPIAPATLEAEAEDEAVGSAPDELRGKEDSD